jgi:hypothetical protein
MVNGSELYDLIKKESELFLTSLKNDLTKDEIIRKVKIYNEHHRLRISLIDEDEEEEKPKRKRKSKKIIYTTRLDDGIELE